MSGYKFTNKSRRQEKKALTIEDVKNDLYLSKFALRVFYMGYAIDSQFKIDNFQNTDINKCKRLFDELGLISTSYYSDLSELDRESIYLSNPQFDKIDKQNPICYVSNQYFAKVGDNLMFEISEAWKHNQGVIDLVNNLKKRKDSFKIIRLAKYKEEHTLMMREVRTPTHTYHKPTIKKREMDIAFLDARSELLQEGNILPKNDLDEQLLKLQNTKILQIEHIKSDTLTALVVVNESTDLIETEYMNNLLTIKDNYDLQKKFKKINSTDNIMDETRTVNIAAVFQDVVKVPNDYEKKCLDDRTPKKYKSDMKKHYDQLTKNARKNSVFIKKNDEGVPIKKWDELSVEASRKSECVNFLDSLDEFVEVEE